MARLVIVEREKLNPVLFTGREKGLKQMHAHKNSNDGGVI